MREHLTAKRAWTAIGLGVAAYELLAPEGELLSEEVDRGMERSKLAKALIMSGIGITALHLVNMLDERVDPYHQAHRLTRRNRV